MDMVSWTITPWLMNGMGGWKQQPVILVEGNVPFIADYPSEYITKLQEMHEDKTIERGKFWTFIGEFKDGLEQHWNIG